MEWEDLSEAPFQLGPSVVPAYPKIKKSLELRYPRPQMRVFGFKLRKKGDQETIVGYNSNKEQLFIDRSRSGRTDFSEHYLGRNSAPLKPVSGEIQIHIFLDMSSVEVFGNYGKRSISSLIFPRADSKEIEFYVEGEKVDILSLKINKVNQYGDNSKNSLIESVTNFAG